MTRKYIMDDAFPALPQLLGIVNVTPTSFSDGGLYNTTEAACQHAVNLLSDGANIIDIGGESTKPGAARITAAEELERILPVVRKLIPHCRVSVDTMRSSIARICLSEGVHFINDVSGSLADPQMATVLAQFPHAQWIISHWATTPTTEPVLESLKKHFDKTITTALDQGVRPEQIIIDPGIGFAKTASTNWEILRNLPIIVSWGFPVLIGVSRKKFLSPYGQEPSERDNATAIISVLAAQLGVWGVRVHNIAASFAALDIYRTMSYERSDQFNNIHPMQDLQNLQNFDERT